MKTLADRLRYARDAAGCPAVTLAALAGLASAHVGMIERGERTRLEYSTLSRIARVLGVSAEWLGEGIGPEPTPDAVRAAVEASRLRAAHTPEAGAPADEPTGPVPVGQTEAGDETSTGRRGRVGRTVATGGRAAA